MRRGRWLSEEEFRLEVATAVGNDEDIIEHFQRRTQARGWKGGDDE